MQKFITLVKKLANFFRRPGGDERGLMEKMRDQYRLVVMNDDTFEEVTSLKLTPLAVYAALSSLVVGTAILVTFLIIWTPLKRYIPGYGNFERDAEISELASKTTELEKELKAREFYIKNLQKIMNGDLADFTKEAEMAKGKPDENNLDSIPSTDIDRIPEDEQVRSAVANGGIAFDPGFVAATAGKSEASLSKEVPLEQLFFMPPVSGQITAGYDLAKSHFGIDVGASKNTAVKSAADGVVISAGYSVETGYNIAVQHPNNVVTLYKHNSVLLKKEGSPVKAGEAIAIIGNSGENTSGPHLHFELWHKGRSVDPRDYINFN